MYTKKILKYFQSLIFRYLKFIEEYFLQHQRMCNNFFNKIALRKTFGPVGVTKTFGPIRYLMGHGMALTKTFGPTRFPRKQFLVAFFRLISADGVYTPRSTINLVAFFVMSFG